MNQQPQGSTTSIVIAAAAALVIGVAGGYAIGHGAAPSTNAAMTNASTSMQESDGVTVGGSKMVRSKDIVDNAVNAKNVTTLVAAVKAAGLVDTLKTAGPFTVFAPTNDAFAALPAGTVDTLLKPENKAQLTSILTYHVVPGTYTAAALRVMAEKGMTLKTVQGETLSFVIDNGALKVQDSKGNKVAIETADVISSNGVTHVVSAVLMP